MHTFTVLPKLLLYELIFIAIMHATFAETFAYFLQQFTQSAINAKKNQQKICFTTSFLTK